MATMLKSSLAILILLAAVMAVVSMDVYGCYHQPETPCSNFTITCNDSERIRIHALQYYTKPSITNCPPLQVKDDCNTSLCCTRNSSDTPVSFSQQDRLSVYTACTNQQSCTVTSPYTPNSNISYHYVHYGYICTPENRIYNIRTTSTKSSEAGFFYLYYGDIAPPAIGSSCSCNVTGTAISIQYINLGVETCNKVTVLVHNKPLFNCTEEPVFIPTTVLQVKYLEIKINQYKPRNGDAILMRIIDAGNVSCDCDNVIKGEWSEWSSFSPCSVSCGNGSQTRTRTCNNLADDATNCAGISNQTRLCNQLPCSEIRGVWSNWSQYGNCSVTCGQGIRIRTRQCIKDPLTNFNEDANCTGNAYDSMTCNELACPGMDGGWSEWSSVSNCSVTCGGGTKLRTRQCNNPTPINEGANCTGPSYKNLMCNTSTCTGTYVQWIVSGVAILAIFVFTIIWFIRLIRTRINTARLYDTSSRQSTDNSPNQEYTELQPQVIDDDHVCSPYLALVNTTNEYAELNAGTMDDVHYRALQPPEVNKSPVPLSNYVNVNNQRVKPEGLYINTVHGQIY